MNPKMHISHLMMSMFLSLFVGCASIHPGNFALEVPTNASTPTLVLSSERNRDLSDSFYTFLTVTIENKSGELIRVQQGSISFDIAESEIPNVLVGRDLDAWLESAESKIKLSSENSESWNRALIFGGLGTSLVGGLSSNSTVGLIGTSLMAGGATKSIVEGQSGAIQHAQAAKMVPETHFGSAFSIPAGGFVRKWIVFQQPKKNSPRGVVLKMVFEDQKVGKYAVALQ
jgi:hypothetical protein